MTTERETTLAALRAFEAACVAARHELHHDQVTAARVRNQLEREEPLAAVIHRNRIANTRVNLTNTVNALEHARNQMRMACFRLGLEEGTTISELGRLWGFSRQLASRIAQEALSAHIQKRPAAKPTASSRRN
jgi:hypothetical protein